MDQTFEKEVRKRWAPVFTRYKKLKKPMPKHYKIMLDEEIKQTAASAGEIKQAIEKLKK